MIARPETIKILEENLDGKLLDFGNRDFFLIWHPNQRQQKQKKKKKVGLHQTKGLLYIKEDHQNEKATYWIGENICKLYIWQEVKSKIKNTYYGISLYVESKKQKKMK